MIISMELTIHFCVKKKLLVSANFLHILKHNSFSYSQNDSQDKSDKNCFFVTYTHIAFKWSILDTDITDPPCYNIIL